MRRFLAAIVTASMTLAIAFLPSVLQRPLHPVVVWVALLVGGSVSLFLLLWSPHSGLAVITAWMRRGTAGIGREHARDADFSKPWTLTQAGQHILCLGVGMRSVARQARVVESAVARGVTVTFVMIDPEWVAHTPQIRSALERFYGTRALVSELRDASELLDQLAASLNGRYGADRVMIHRHRELSLMSSTIGDWKGDNPFGSYESHLWGNRRRRPRMNFGPQRTPPLRDVIDTAEALITSALEPRSVLSPGVPEETAVVLTRAPGSPLSKTRLAHEIGRSAATQAAYELLGQTTQNAVSTGLPVVCAYSGDEDDISGVRRLDVTYVRVGGADASAMNSLDAAIAWSRDHNQSRVVIVPSDAPTVDADLMREMLAHLAHHDVVISPSSDGGIAAVAVRTSIPLRFSKIAGSSGRVAQDVQRQAVASGLDVHVAASRTDIDDVSSLAQALREGQLAANNPLFRIVEREGLDAA